MLFELKLQVICMASTNIMQSLESVVTNAHGDHVLALVEESIKRLRGVYKDKLHEERKKRKELERQNKIVARKLRQDTDDVLLSAFKALAKQEKSFTRSSLLKLLVLVSPDRYTGTMIPKPDAGAFEDARKYAKKMLKNRT